MRFWSSCAMNKIPYAMVVGTYLPYSETFIYD